MGVSRATGRRGETFYLLVGIYVCALGLLGFARNFYLRPLGVDPLADSGPIYPGVVLHGLLFTAWMALAVYQPWQVRTGRILNHRCVGIWTAWLAVALFVTGIYVGGVQAARFATEGRNTGLFAIPFIVMLGFMVAMGFAIWFRHRPEWHKRWIVIAHAQLLEPAAARALSTLELPVFPLILIVISLPVLGGLAYDIFAKRRIPGIYLMGLALVLGSGFLRHGLARHPGWIELTDRLFA